LKNRKVVTRFAPSPTGYLHVGGARTALFNWLLARSTGGDFLLRVEDTDLARSSEESVRSLLEDLRWLGLDWDNRTLIFQSKRQAVYNALIDELIGKELAYHAYETPAELTAQRQIAERQKRPYLYRRPQLTDEQIRQYKSEGRPSVVRFAMPAREYRFTDVVLGKEIVLGESQVQDFVIRKTDGMPTYHFAVVADDAAMGITHILRGQEHLLNTVNHIALQQALGYPRPIYGHLPVILNPDGAKMGKRDRDKIVKHHAHLWLKSHNKTAADLAAESHLPIVRVQSWLVDESESLDCSAQKQIMRQIGLACSALPEISVREFRAAGYLHRALAASLTQAGSDETFEHSLGSLREIAAKFSLQQIPVGNITLNRESLLQLNSRACAEATPTSLVPEMRDYLSEHPDSPLNLADDSMLVKILKMNVPMRTLSEVDSRSRFLLAGDRSIAYDPALLCQYLLVNDHAGVRTLVMLQRSLDHLIKWSAPELESLLQSEIRRTRESLHDLQIICRIAISGADHGLPLSQCLEFLGRGRVLARMNHCITAALQLDSSHNSSPSGQHSCGKGCASNPDQTCEV